MVTKFKIVSTLGPASLNKKFLKTCYDIDQNHYRLNASHLTVSQIKKYFRFVTGILKKIQVDFYLDLQGSKLRIGKLLECLNLFRMDEVELVLSEQAGFNQIPLSHHEIFQFAEIGDHLILQDASVKLEVLKVQTQLMTARIVEGKALSSGSGIIIRNKSLPGKKNLTCSKKAIQTCGGIKYQPPCAVLCPRTRRYP